MIYAWRNSWKKEFPFYFVQIAPFSYGNNFDGALLKEAQFQTLKSVPKTGMVVTTDITGDTNDIHPKNKQDVGKRLALWALANTYKQTDIHFSGPLYRSLKIVGNKAVVEFDYAKEGLIKKRDQLTDFFIAGEDRIFYRATATIKDSTVIVSSPEVSRPVAVRMGFSNTAIPDLFNKAGLPASPFRTDNWDLKKEE
jgi:sialate O-acetylesterase